MQGALRTFARRVAGAPTFRTVQTRRMAGQAGAREKALLEEDPALREFRSEKKTIKRIQRFGDVLVLAVVTGAVYEIYWRVQARNAAAEAEQASK
ncbi:hypothetical protein R1sor_024363 [Riccia sorocarpa]|uniref:Succinate dehydrogenase subunit 7A, mitochondrial n=1 Tax=Riccia sorocarpa TaxID=122646 RepID=A0ABD3GQA8_9MARC